MKLSSLKLTWGRTQRKDHELPVPVFAHFRPENGQIVASILWENEPVTRECFKTAKDMCASLKRSDSLQITNISSHDLEVWNDTLKEKMQATSCPYLNKVSKKVFDALIEMERTARHIPTGPASAQPQAPHAA